MRGLLKYLSPFAPDQSGAVSVLYDLGGIIVICDAGGCTGNICGFDEPRWFLKKSAIFSAGLRDMDAILGRDDRLVQKLKDTAQKVEAKFAGIIGTPVPAVIATDFLALRRMAEKRCNLPVITVECTGTRLYDEGEEETYLALFKRFAEDSAEVRQGTLGVIGATPLNVSDVFGDRKIRKIYKDRGYTDVYCYGMGDGLEELKLAGSVEKNLVIAPSGLKAAKYLQERFGTPYEEVYPLISEELKARLQAVKDKKVLVIHQQAQANALREILREDNRNDVTLATWFLLKKEWKEEGDLRLHTEEAFRELVEKECYDVIVGDAFLSRALPGYEGEFIHVPHFAVSGECIQKEE